MPRGTNLPAIGEFNQTVILDLIRRSPAGLSRVELAARTGLSAPTISNVCRRLLDGGLIIEAGKSIQGPGKPRVILKLEPRSRFAIGVHIDPTAVTYVLVDLHGTVVTRTRKRTPARLITTLAGSINRLIDESEVDRSALLGVGIAAPGPIDATRGIALDLPVRETLSNATELPVVLEKDVTAATMAEQWCNSDKRENDFAFFYFGAGIGVGLALDGTVLRGATGNAGSLVVDAAVLKNQTAPLIASTIVSIVNLLDVTEIVCGGPYWDRTAERFLGPIGELVNGSTNRVTQHGVAVHTSTIGTDVAAIGAACLVLDTTIAPRTSSLLISV